jgi:hypothetical protein
MAQTPENVPKYVLCRRPQEYPDGREAEFVEVELFPTEKFGKAKAIWDISASASPEERRAYEVAWAAGYRVIRRLTEDPMCLRLVGQQIALGMIEATADELNSSIWDASRFTRAYLASKCPQCSRAVILPGTQFQAESRPEYQMTGSVSLQCGCGVRFDSVWSERLVHVEYLGSALEQAVSKAG